MVQAKDLREMKLEEILNALELVSNELMLRKSDFDEESKRLIKMIAKDLIDMV